MCDTRLGYLARCVYGILAMEARGKESSVGQVLIAQRLGTYQPNVAGALRELEECGHIEIRSVGHKRRVYRLTSPLFVDERKVTRMPRRRQKVAAGDIF